MSSSRVPSIPFRNVQPKASHGKPAETSVTAATLQIQVKVSQKILVSVLVMLSE